MDSLTTVALAARDGDRAALARFVELAQADVWRYCAYLTDAQTADDAAQETLIRAIGSLHGFRGEGDAKVWLLTIARRTCADIIRSQVRRRSLFDRLRGQHDPTPVAPSERLELAELLESLDDDRRDAFVLTQVLGLSYEEAAGVMNCAIGTIRSRVARARMHLVDVVIATDDRRALGS
ncbi:MAG: sigma-70 family RNA polymerase sigma factor [Actinobacteria bacterium]|nr:sigma-70 family RNA polymerase sigma factor [Actinomycetota bacterium]